MQARGDTVLAAPCEALDLTDQHAVRLFLQRERPEVVILAAARAGGIQANDRFPGEFLNET